MSRSTSDDSTNNSTSNSDSDNITTNRSNSNRTIMVLDEKTVAWDLGTLTGISAAVLSTHFDKVVTIERNNQLATFAKKHLPENCTVIEDEIETWLMKKATNGEQANL